MVLIDSRRAPRLYGEKRRCDRTPAAKRLAEHRRNPELADAIWVVVDVDVDVDVDVAPYLGRAEKIIITVPARVLRRIDEFARTHGQTRSGFLTQAGLEAMRRGSG